MFRFCLIALLLVAAAFAGPTSAADVVLAPNAKLVFEFPDLPATYRSTTTGDKSPVMMSAQLPENYSADRKFPLFVYLHGGSGAKGDDPSFGRTIVGTRDFIAV